MDRRFVRPETLRERLADLPDAPPPSDVHRAAVAILLRQDRGESEVLLMRRARREGDRWSGQIGLPGGHVESFDGGLLEAAMRETREEVGLDLPAQAAYLGNMDPVHAKSKGRVLEFTLTPFVFHTSTHVVPVCGPEADEAFWFPLERAHAGGLAAVHHYDAPDGVRRALPAWDYADRRIWGLTYEILSRLLRLGD